MPGIRKGLSERSQVSRDLSGISGRQLCRCLGRSAVGRGKVSARAGGQGTLCGRDSQRPDRLERSERGAVGTGWSQVRWVL